MTGAEAMAASDALGEILKQPVLLAGSTTMDNPTNGFNTKGTHTENG